MAQPRYALVVEQIIDETPDAYTIRLLNPEPELFRYKPGQYLTLHTIINGQVERRAFSLSSSPFADPYLAVTIKCITGGVVSNYLKKTLREGSTLEVLPPMGNFTLDIHPTNARHYVLIGGGSGITPLMSMLTAVLAEEPKSVLTLIYGNRDEQSIIFRQRLQALGAHYGDRLKVVHVLEKPTADWAGPTGLLDEALLQTLLTQAVNTSTLPVGYYLCGPTPMMENAKRVLAAQGVAHTQVFTEYYTAPITSEKEAENEAVAETIVTQQVKVKLDKKEYTLTVHPNQSILEAAIKAKLDPPYACQEGVCCSCRAKLLSGQVQMDENAGLSDKELASGYILTCQSHPLTADVSIVYG